MITSLSNTLVKETIKLQRKSSFRHKQKLFVAEGFRMFGEIPLERLKVVFALEPHLDEVKKGIESQDIKLYTVTNEILKAMSQEVTPQGVLMWVRIEDGDESPQTVDKDFVIATDCVQDPGNLGTLLRTAEAAGVKRVLLSKGTVDLYNPKVVKATMGAIFRLSIEQDVDLVQSIEKMKAEAYEVIGTHLNGSGTHYEVDYRSSVCVVVGNEGNGMSDLVANACTQLVKIPMNEVAESLNVAMAAGIMMYEVVRQRR